MIVAILDDGICREEIKTKVERYCVGKSADPKAAFDNIKSHATICAKIIEKYSSPKKIYDIAFLGGDDTATPDDMISALEFCLGLDIDVINLSNGIEICGPKDDYMQRLLNVCCKLYEKGVHIFAAQSNSGMATVPALFGCTISVEQMRFVSNIMQLPYRKSDIYTNGVHMISLGGKKHFTVMCNSYSCPYAVAKFINKGRLHLHRVTCDANLMKKKPLKTNGKLTGFELSDPYSGNNQGYVFFERIGIKKKLLYRINGQKYHSLHYSRLQYLFISFISSMYKKSDTPVVFIRNGSGSGKIANSLNSFFSLDGYNTAFFSVNKQHYYYGAYYVPEKLIKSYINYFSAVNSPDIIFIVVNDSYDNESIMINSEDNRYKVLSDNKTQVYTELASVINVIYQFYK